ncbi:Protocadherin Fat 4 [Mactra antiquata]
MARTFITDGHCVNLLAFHNDIEDSSVQFIPRTVSYSISNGNVDNKVTIDPSTGDIILVQSLDFETATNNPYLIEILAVDGDTVSSRTSTTTVHFTINDVNDNIPICVPVVNSVSVAENVALPSTLLSLNCYDNDTGLNAALTFTQTSVTPISGTTLFTTDTNGAVRVVLAPDYETDKNFAIVIEVNDGGTPSLTTTATVNVEITDINDNTPAFQNLPYTVSVIENTAIGSTVFTVNATDGDIDESVTFSLNPSMTNFDVDPNSGDVILKADVDYELQTTYEVIVVGTDDGTNPGTDSATATVTITITNYNDGTPEFDPGFYAISLSENTGNGVTVVTVSIVDVGDITFTYSIVSGNGDNIFDITGTTDTADIIVNNNTNLDFETTSSYSLVIDVTDSGGLSGSATVEIEITGYNEHTPVLTSSSSTKTVAENSMTGTLVVDIDATDADTGEDGVITYSIVSGANGKFSLDPSSGEVFVGGSLDREGTSTYTILIDAVDSGTTPGALTAQYTLTVTISDVNDVSPVCSSSLYNVRISEGTTIGSSIAQIVCTDADSEPPNSNISTYTFTSGNPGGEFSISTTGVVTSNVLFDRETTDNYLLEIIVTDDGVTPSALSTTTSLTVVITDENDNTPTFQQTVYNFNQNEDTAIGSVTGTVNATDDDINLAASISYRIHSGNDDGKFGLDKSTGDLILLSSLDYETVTSYTLIVHAVDKEATFLTGTATISFTVNDVNDIEPICTSSLYTGSVSEDAMVGTSVATVTCSDSDSTVGNILTYSITSGHTDFSIDSNTGVVSVNAALDIEFTPRYDITVQASDGSNTVDVTVSINLIDVNDETPVYSPPGPYAVTITENIAIGSTLYNITATDADVSLSTFIFTITSGNTDNKFKIGASSGILQTQSTIDRDDPLTTSYTLEIEVADGTIGALTATTSIVITVDDENDNYPNCDAPSYTVNVPEDTVPGSTLITPTCNDTDLNSSPTLSYSVTSGNGDSKFQINSGSGILTLQASLDYETTTSYTLTVQVDDQGVPNLITTVTMYVYVEPVNEATPAFQGTPYDTTILESATYADQVVRVSATDSDVGSTHGNIRYEITSGNNAGHFSIDQSSGWITVSGPLDYENTVSYALTVAASDMLSGDADMKSAETTFAITITDENDNYPEFNPATYAATVNENASGMSASIIQVLATDDDSGTLGTAGLQYSITSGNTGNPFSIDSTTGWIILSGNVDANTQTIYILLVKASDQGAPPLEASTIVTIQVVAINEHAPTFSSSADTVTLSESETIGNSIYTAVASDSDTGEFAVLRYYLISGNTGNAFSLNMFDGTLRVANALDYDTIDEYILEIEVQDTEQTTTDTQSSTLTLTVTLTDANDETPVFTSNVYTANLNENEPVLTSVVTVTAIDSDTGVNGDITYSITSGTGAIVFSVDGTTGIISTNAVIDFETLISYDLAIQAIDGGSPSLSSTCIVRITIIDLNDNTPIFQADDVAISINESTAVGTIIATAKATDIDSASNNNNVIVYSLTPGTKFAIDMNSGDIRVTNQLDRETDSSHVLTILATDQGTPANTGTATYTVVLIDENDNPPVVSGTYDTSIPEDTVINTIVFNISVTDDDENENSVLTYSITNGNTDGDFIIDSGSGIIQVVNVLDRERTDKYSLEITIVDNGASPLSATVTGTVTISDINDNNPIFQPAPITTYTFNITENNPVGTLVDRVSATDDDIGANGAIVFTIAYSIEGDHTHFALDSTSGDITTATILDRETRDLYVFVIRASDGGANTLTSTATVSISVTDFNDNEPSFSQALYTATITENQPPGTSILTVAITDIDMGINQNIQLSITDPTADMYISPNSSDYVLYVKLAMDRETFPSFDFILTATDQGTPPLSFTTSIEITIGDANDNAPVFSPTFYNSEIAYNDGCQVTVTTVTATDLDEGINAVFTYSTTLNNNPHLFALDANTGDITLVATAVADVGYTMYVAATDNGSPSQSSSTGATVRMDTYNPSSVVLNFYMNITISSYIAMETTFLTQLTTVYQQSYPGSAAKRWCVTSRSDGSVKVQIYVVKNYNETDDVVEINVDKTYLTMNQAYAIVASDDAGTPAAVITGISWTSFVIKRVEKYVVTESEESTPWIKTTAGVVTVGVLSTLGFIVILVICIVCIYKLREPSAQRNRVEVADDDDGDKVAKNQYHTKHTSMIHTAADIKSFDKDHLPPAVVSLPMPSAIKKVPLQRGNAGKSFEKPNLRDENLYLEFEDNGPTLIKKREKLRATSPVQTEPAPLPRRLPPVHKPAVDKNDPEFLQDASTYNVMNREFDGRAIDPASGRVYEYNTKTNERRWVRTPDGQQVRLRKDV